MSEQQENEIVYVEKENNSLIELTMILHRI